MNINFDHTRKSLIEALCITTEEAEKTVVFLDEIDDMYFSQSELVAAIVGSGLADNCKIWCICSIMRQWGKNMAEKTLGLVAEGDLDTNKFKDV